MISGLGYNQRDVQKCQINGLVYVPFTGRCERPDIARQIIAAAEKHGLGFLADENGYLSNQSGGSEDWGGYFFDPFGNYFEYDWFTGNPSDYYQGLDYGYWVGADGTLYTLNPDAASNDFSFANPNPPITGSSTPSVSTTGVSTFPEIMSGEVPDDAVIFPGYCKGGTYHPLPSEGDPLSCVPFPNDDATKKKQAAIQRQGRQQQARQQQKQQQQASQTCPKDPQGRAVWRNPATQKCELVPQCPSGQTFDQVTRRCLTAAQRNELYGNQSNWLWWIVGGVLFLLYVGNRRGGESSTPWRRKRL